MLLCRRGRGTVFRILIHPGHGFKSQLPSQQSWQTAINDIHREALNITHILGLRFANIFVNLLFFLAG